MLPTPYSDGLSPRVRGNRFRAERNLEGLRSIPARAGEPRGGLTVWNPIEVYPRACGGTGARKHRNPKRHGLSPRVRGNRFLHFVALKVVRSIPARAGKPGRGPVGLQD